MMNEVPYNAPPIKLVRVFSEIEEALVLDLLEQHGPTGRRSTAPVLDRDDLVEKLRDALAAAGLSVQIDSFRGGTNFSVYDGGAHGAPTLGLLAVGEGVVANVARLASVISSSPVVALESLTEESISRIRRSERSAILIGSRAPGMGKTSPAVALERLRSAGFLVGVIWAEDALSARFAILKALLGTQITSTGRVGRISGTLSSAVLPGAPHFIFAGSDLASTWFREARDILVASGHSTGIDALLHPELIICSRKRSSRKDHSFTPVLPCFNDGVCYRLIRLGRDGRSEQTLTSPDEADCRVLILIGCNVAALGPTWYSAEDSIISRATQGTALAVVASLAIVPESLELDMLLVALLLDGHCLGDAVEEANLARNRARSNTEIQFTKYRPLVAFGNPFLRLVGQDVHSVKIKLSGRSLVIPLERLGHKSEFGSWIKCDIGNNIHYLVLDKLPESVWCRGALTSTGDLYLCVRISPAADRKVECIAVTVFENEPWQPERAALRRFISRLPFWMILLQVCITDRAGKGRQVVDFERALQALPQTLVDFTQTFVGTRPARGIVMQPSANLWPLLFRKMADTSNWLLSLVVQTAEGDGTLQISEWVSTHEFVETDGPIGLCACGTGRMWRFRYRSVNFESSEIYEYECELCGPRALDDGRRILRLIEPSVRALAGATVDFNVDICALEEERVVCVIVAVLQGLTSRPLYVSKRSAFIVESGRTRRITVQVVVPGDVTPGHYPLAIAAVVNGALYLWRQMLHILPGSE